MLNAFAVREAIHGKLTSTRAITDLVSTRIFHLVAPHKDESGRPVQFPLVTFHREGASPRDAFQRRRALHRETWVIKCVDAQTTSSVAEAAQAAIVDAMEAGIAVSGAVVHDVRYLGPIDYPEDENGRQYRHHGARFRVVLSET